MTADDLAPVTRPRRRLTLAAKRSLTFTTYGKGDSTKNCIENAETPENEIHELEHCCTDEGQSNLVAAEQQPIKGLGEHELSEELTEFLLVILQELKAGTLTAGDTASSQPVVRQVTGIERSASRAGASSDAQ
jgi:hypothetical protein